LLQNRPLSEDELLEIVDEAQPSGIQKLMIASKISVTKYDSFDQYISTLDGWYEAKGLQIALVAKKNENEGESNRKRCHPHDDSGKGYKGSKNRAVEADRNRNVVIVAVLTRGLRTSVIARKTPMTSPRAMVVKKTISMSDTSRNQSA
jgi:hypothetical protein